MKANYCHSIMNTMGPNVPVLAETGISLKKVFFMDICNDSLNSKVQIYLTGNVWFGSDLGLGLGWRNSLLRL